MTSGENIEYAIFKCVSEYSFIEWLETWDISRDDWKTFMDAGRTAVDNSNKEVKRWIYHPYYEHCGECAYECPICGMGSDCDHNFCMRCGTKLARANKG